jgi:hypothetical protein
MFSTGEPTCLLPQTAIPRNIEHSPQKMVCINLSLKHHQQQQKTRNLTNDQSTSKE